MFENFNAYLKNLGIGFQVFLVDDNSTEKFIDDFTKYISTLLKSKNRKSITFCYKILLKNNSSTNSLPFVPIGQVTFELRFDRVNGKLTEYHIERIDIDEDKRGKGYGTFLLAFLLHKLRAIDENIVCSVHSFYRSAFFYINAGFAYTQHTSAYLINFNKYAQLQHNIITNWYDNLLTKKESFPIDIAKLFNEQILYLRKQNCFHFAEDGEEYDGELGFEFHLTNIKAWQLLHERVNTIYKNRLLPKVDELPIAEAISEKILEQGKIITDISILDKILELRGEIGVVHQPRCAYRPY